MFPPSNPDPAQARRPQLPALRATTDPFGTGDEPLPPGPWRSRTVAALLAMERHNRNVRRMLARAAADHLFQAASLLREVPSADAVVLSAAGMAEALYALDEAARALGGALPADFTAHADQLPAWAAAVKHHSQAAAEHDRRGLVRVPRWPRRADGPARPFD